MYSRNLEIVESLERGIKALCAFFKPLTLLFLVAGRLFYFYFEGDGSSSIFTGMMSMNPTDNLGENNNLESVPENFAVQEQNDTSSTEGQLTGESSISTESKKSAVTSSTEDLGRAVPARPEVTPAAAHPEITPAAAQAPAAPAAAQAPAAPGAENYPVKWSISGEIDSKELGEAAYESGKSLAEGIVNSTPAIVGTAAIIVATTNKAISSLPFSPVIKLGAFLTTAAMGFTGALVFQKTQATSKLECLKEKNKHTQQMAEISSRSNSGGSDNQRSRNNSDTGSTPPTQKVEPVQNTTQKSLSAEENTTQKSLSTKEQNNLLSNATDEIETKAPVSPTHPLLPQNDFNNNLVSTTQEEGMIAKTLEFLNFPEFITNLPIDCPYLSLFIFLFGVLFRVRNVIHILNLGFRFSQIHLGLGIATEPSFKQWIAEVFYLPIKLLREGLFTLPESKTSLDLIYDFINLAPYWVLVILIGTFLLTVQGILSQLIRWLLEKPIIKNKTVKALLERFASYRDKVKQYFLTPIAIFFILLGCSQLILIFYMVWCLLHELK